MRLPYIVATALYCGFLWVLSSDTSPPEFEFPWQILGLDKVVHATLYAVLGTIVSVGMRRSGKPVSAWAQCFVPILFAALYGLTDEIHQLYVPNRTFDVGDLLANLAGATLAQAGLCYAYWRRAPQEVPKALSDEKAQAEL
ncbi:MAG: VanZ family protein [Candidatus Hydrogenedentes bacterium]|nr:VanZ family protein [Candidatus Hydrogenedentota bacterium]